MSDMERVTIRIETESGFRASEVVGDLQNVAQVLFTPLRPVAFWDGSNRSHSCLEERRSLPCPHYLPPDDPGYVDYDDSAASDFRARLRVDFEPAQVRIYLR